MLPAARSVVAGAELVALLGVATGVVVVEAGAGVAGVVAWLAVEVGVGPIGLKLVLGAVALRLSLAGEDVPSGSLPNVFGAEQPLVAPIVRTTLRPTQIAIGFAHCTLPD
jgi:hypothetical protein